jgi:hypothetical protein
MVWYQTLIHHTTVPPMPQNIPVPASEVFAMMPSSPILKGQCSVVGVVLSLMPCLSPFSMQSSEVTGRKCPIVTCISISSSLVCFYRHAHLPYQQRVSPSHDTSGRYVHLTSHVALLYSLRQMENGMHVCWTSEFKHGQLRLGCDPNTVCGDISYKQLLYVIVRES